jgi:phage terminase Nu1 subunit (DNA packaging protein)
MSGALLITKAELAKLWELKPRQIERYVSEQGMPCQGKRRTLRFDVAQVEEWRNRHHPQRPRASTAPRHVTTESSAGDGTAPVYSLELARWTQQKADAAAMANQLKRGELVSKDAVYDLWAHTVEVVKTNLRRIPVKVALELSQETRPAVIQQRILKEIDAVLQVFHDAMEEHQFFAEEINAATD